MLAQKKIPNPKNKKLHSLETKNKIELEIDEKDPIFFLPEGEVSRSPCFELGEKKLYRLLLFEKRRGGNEKNIAGKIFNGVRSQSVSMRFQTYKRRIFRNRFSLKTK